MTVAVTRKYGADPAQLPASSVSPSLQVCIQVRARKLHSLNSELTGACSLLTPNLDLQAEAYFSDLGNLNSSRQTLVLEGGQASSGSLLWNS